MKDALFFIGGFILGALSLGIYLVLSIIVLSNPNATRRL